VVLGAESNRRRNIEPNYRNFCTGSLKKWKDWREGPGIEPGVFQCNVSGVGWGAAGGGGGGGRREAGERA